MYTPLKAGYTDYNIDIFFINIILRIVYWCSKSYSVLSLTCHMNCPLSVIVAAHTLLKLMIRFSMCLNMANRVCFIVTFSAILVTMQNKSEI
jgi:hypothetical protein